MLTDADGCLLMLTDAQALGSDPDQTKSEMGAWYTQYPDSKRACYYSRLTFGVHAPNALGVLWD